MDPAAVMEASKVAADEFRRDYLVASVIVLLVVNGAWALGVRALVRALAAAQEARVADQKEDRQRYEALTERTAVHMDKLSEMSTLLLADAQRRSRAKRAADPEGQ